MDEQNTNVLEGFRCPNCGSLGPFWIQATISAGVLMSDEGTVEENVDSTDWEDDSYCRCPECDKEGVVKDFRPE